MMQSRSTASTLYIGWFSIYMDLIGETLAEAIEESIYWRLEVDPSLSREASLVINKFFRCMYL